MGKFILIVNAGSSSIKVDLYADDETSQGYVLQRFIARSYTAENRDETMRDLFQSLRREFDGGELVAIGHRIVHGGPKYHQTTEISQEVRNELLTIAKFDPEHGPLALEIINQFSSEFASTKQYACFDTSFFTDLPKVASTLPLPKLVRDRGVKKYGFHGLSYDYLLNRFGEVAGQAAMHGRIIIAHLGSGASMAAIKEAKPVDTTMSLTPASGFMMSSRSGDVDPGIFAFLDLSAEDFNNMANKHSGLLAISGISSSLKDILEKENDNDDAALAVEMFVYQLRKNIAALAATMGGLDSLIFSGGIGEQSSLIRHRVCEGLGFLGIELDSGRNSQHLERISSDYSKVGVHVIPTNESAVMLREVANKLKQGENQ